MVEAPFDQLDGDALGAMTLRVDRWLPESKSGWRRFHLVLTGEDGEALQPPVMIGIYSRGGRGVDPWIEVLAYHSKVARGGEAVDLARQGLEVPLFQRLGRLIPPGGHLMVGCERDAQRVTYRALSAGVPPVATPLGAALYRAGFPRVRFFDLAEGGWEGQQKLWAERPLDGHWAARWRRETLASLREFMDNAPQVEEARAGLAIAAYILKESENLPTQPG